MSRTAVIGARGAALFVLACLLATACGSTPPPPSPGSEATSGPSPAPATSAPTVRVSESASPSTVPTNGPSGTPDVPGARATMPSADQLAAELAAPETLTACLALLGVPAAADDGNGEPVGYNVAFARELASRLGLTLDLNVVSFDELATQIESNACDVSVSSQNITESRLATMVLTPYTQSLQPVVVRYGNPLGIFELADLCGRIVSATSGTTHVDFVNGTGDYAGEGLDEVCAAARQPSPEIRTFQSDLEAVQALIAEEVAAYLGNTNFYYDYRDDLDIQGTPALPPARQGIATALDRPAITAAVQAALNDMIDDGTYLAILREHLLTQESVEAVSIVD